MRLCRFTARSGTDVRIGLVTSSQTVFDLTDAGVVRMKVLLERPDLLDELARLSRTGPAQHPLDGVRLLTPVEAQEVTRQVLTAEHHRADVNTCRDTSCDSTGVNSRTPSSGC